MKTVQIISAIDAELTTLRQIRSLLTEYAALDSSPVRRGRGRPKKVSLAKPKKWVMSAEARARIAMAQKKRWAAQKKAAK